jgi:hypothetical protein
MSARGLVSIVVSALFAAGSVAGAGEPSMHVVTIAGRAEVQGAGANMWSAAKLRADLGLGASVRTVRGRIVLETPSGQEVRLAGLSKVSLLEPDAEMPTPVRLDAGSVWVAVTPGTASRQQIEIQGQAATVVVSRGGVLLALGQDGAVLVRVYHGAATASGPGTERRWSRAVAEGQEMLVPSGGAPEAPRKIAEDKNVADWVKWNEDQDRAGGFGSPAPEK